MVVLCGAAEAERQGSVGLGHTAGKGRHREENIMRRNEGEESPITKRLTCNSEKIAHN